MSPSAPQNWPAELSAAAPAAEPLERQLLAAAGLVLAVAALGGGVLLGASSRALMQVRT